MDNITYGEGNTSLISNWTEVVSHPHFSNTVHAAVALYLLGLAMIAIPANVSTILLFVKNKSLRSPMNLMFVNLAVSDLMVSFCGTFCQGLTVTFRLYLKVGGTLCNLYGFGVYLGGEASLISLMVIAAERYVTVIRPFNMGSLSYAGAIGAIVFVWSFALVWAGGPLVGWSAYIPEGLGTWCSIDWRPINLSNISYFYTLFIVSFLMPVAIIVFCYLSVWMKVREMAKAASATESSQQAERLIAKMSCIMVIFYMFAWTPYAVVGAMVAMGPPGMISHSTATLPSLFAKSSCIYNPIIYIGMNKAFRHAFFMMVLGRDPFKKEADQTSIGNATVGGGGNRVAPVS